MSRRLSRRLADALCAFRTGHSVRDLDRARMRRLVLLGGRMAQRLRREARSFRGDALGDMVASHRDELADKAERLVHALAQPGQREVAPVLLHQLQVDRAHLYVVRVRQWRDVRADNGPGDEVVQRADILPALSGERYGKLLEGLVEHRMLDPFEEKLRFCIRSGHRVLRAVWGQFRLRILREAR